MNVRVETGSIASVAGDWLVVGLFEGAAELDGNLAAVDQATDGVIRRMREAGDLTGKPLEITLLPDVAGLAAPRLAVVGLGARERFDAGQQFRAAAAAARAISTKPRKTIAFDLLGVQANSVKAERSAETITAAALVGSQGQDLYRSERKRTPFGELVLVAEPAQGADAERGARQGEVLGGAANLARRLVNEPPAVIYPASFAEQAEAVAKECRLKCTILDENALRAERMNSMLAVAAGSARPPRMVVLEHRGGTGGATLALVGKGVTFDSGGLSLKTAEGMTTMKCDMAGAATVLGAMQAIARLDLPVHVVGYMGLVENLPSGTAMKVGDVLTARNGKTIEVLNTDAEGRLVLADVLSYAVDQKPDHLIDLATLTGSCVVALGNDVAGLMGNNQPWIDRVRSAADAVGEPVWQLPLFDLYTELIKSEVADIKNTGGRNGGALTAGKFLENFVAGVPWVHLDIAGPAFFDRDNAWRDGGASGLFVRTLVEVARNY
jgi:leucyl aminopeptidase